MWLSRHPGPQLWSQLACVGREVAARLIDEEAEIRRCEGLLLRFGPKGGVVSSGLSAPMRRYLVRVRDACRAAGAKLLEVEILAPDYEPVDMSDDGW